MNLRKICLFTVGLSFIILTSCLASGQKEKIKKPAIIWLDAETKNILFTSHDIIFFDWDKQLFLLRREAALDFSAWIPPHMHLYRKLSVEDSSGPIYEAHWVSLASSMGFGGPIYGTVSYYPFLSITNCYPPRKDPIVKYEDSRFTLRLKAGLKKDGVLQSIDLNRDYSSFKFETTHQTWKKVGKDMKIRIEYFNDTFRLGEKARAHIFFAGGKETIKDIDSITLKITHITNQGTFRSDTIVEGIPISETIDGIYVCKFTPWKPVEGSDKEPGNGTGTISLAILLKKQAKTMHRLDFTESHIPIVGRMAAEQKSPPKKE